MTYYKTSQLLLLFLCAIVSSCSRYAVSVNDQTVYSPSSLFKNYTITDPDLKECVRRTIADQHLTTAEQLTRLFCPEGNIRSLSGIKTFTKIRQLGFQGNQIRTIDLLADLRSLEQLNLSHNQIIDFSPLKNLNQLAYLDTQGNADAICSSLPTSSKILQLATPIHCTRSLH
ncbi:MAG: Leucine-rich repeat (LRR) protein [Lentisphaeria bacterium]|jgi:Leucine-rich repeat (LRR) protein